MWCSRAQITETKLSEGAMRRGKPGAWKAGRLSTRPDQLVRVGKGAQEQFLEYAHYLPERSVAAAVDRQRVAGYAVLESTELAQDMDAEQVCALRLNPERAHVYNYQ